MGAQKLLLIRDTGKPVSAGFDHVVKGHFDVEVSNSRSVFTISPNELKGVLQSSPVIKLPATALPVTSSAALKATPPTL